MFFAVIWIKMELIFLTFVYVMIKPCIKCVFGEGWGVNAAGWTSECSSGHLHEAVV